MQVQKISYTPSFNGAPGRFLNPYAESQKNMLKETLKNSFDEERNIVIATNNSIKKVFPKLKFKLASIDSLKNKAFIASKPLIETMTLYRVDKPFSYIFVNGQKVLDILNDEKDGIYGYKKLDKLTESIAEKVTLANEPHFISEVVSDFTQRLFAQDDVTTETIKSSMRESLVKFDIDIDNDVVEKFDSNEVRMYTDGTDCNVVSVAATKDNIKTTMYLNKNLPDMEQFTTIPHNFSCVLAENSKMFNQLKIDLKRIKNCRTITMVNATPVFVELAKTYPDFLDWPVVIKKEIYSDIIANTLSSIPAGKDKELAFKQILNQIAEEALAYSNMPPALDETLGKKYLPIDKYYMDFHEFLCGVNPTDYVI